MQQSYMLLFLPTEKFVKLVLIVCDSQDGFDILYVELIHYSLQKSAILWLVNLKCRRGRHHGYFGPRVFCLQNEGVCSIKFRKDGRGLTYPLSTILNIAEMVSNKHTTNVNILNSDVEIPMLKG